MNVPLWAALPALGFAIVAAQADVRTRKIPNWLTFPAILLGLLTHLALGGREGFLASLAGMAVVLVALIPGWLLRWMGAGDVKLMAGFGALLGAGRLLEAALWTAGIGGILAVGALAWKTLRRNRN